MRGSELSSKVAYHGQLREPRRREAAGELGHAAAVAAEEDEAGAGVVDDRRRRRRGARRRRHEAELGPLVGTRREGEAAAAGWSAQPVDGLARAAVRRDAELLLFGEERRQT